MTTMQQFCLRWNNHQPNFISVFSSLLNSESLVDVTLAAEGRHLQAHKVVLSACSSYFQSLFTINPCQHPIVILKDVKFIDLKVMVDFMYYGEVNVSQEQLPHILKTAEMLKIKGLAEMPDATSLTKSQSNSTERAELLTPGDSNWSSDAQRRSLSPSCPLSPSMRRKRLRQSSTGSGSGSTERTTEEHQNDQILTSPGGSVIGHIKTDPGFPSECTTPLRTIKQHSSDSEPLKDSSQEGVEPETPHQITLQIPQQSELNLAAQNIETSPVDLAGPSNSSLSQPPSVPVSETPQSSIIIPKRGRLLMRQPRIKKESDSSQPSPEDSLTPQFLTVPHRMERQCSEPLPTISPPPLNLLTIPGTGILVKQHSHPLLPSQTQADDSCIDSKVSFLPNCELSDEGNSESNQLPVERKVGTKRIRNADKQWKLEKVYDDRASADQAILQEDTWSYSFSNNLVEGGITIYYRCNKVKFRGQQCQASVHLHCPADGRNVTLYRSGLSHNCHEIVLKARPKLNAEIKQEMTNLFHFDHRIKPKAILQSLSQKGMEVTNKTLINNYLAFLRMKKFGSSTE